MRSSLLAPALLAATIALATVLGGCAATTADTKPSHSSTPKASTATQSVKEACGELEVSATTAVTALGDASTALASDPTGAAATFAAAAAAFDDDTSNIENDDVREAAEPASGSITHLSDLFTEIAADPANADMDTFNAAVSDFQDAFSAIGDVCE